MLIGRGSGKWNMMMEQMQEMKTMKSTCLVADTIYDLTKQLEHFHTLYNVTHVVYYVFPDYCAAEVQYKIY